MNEILERVQKDIQKHFDDEIMKILANGTGASFQQKSSCDPISDLNDMVCKMATLIMCSPKNKELLEKRKAELPHMTKIFANPYLEDDELYLITDEEVKKSMLECMRISEMKNNSRKENP